MSRSARIVSTGRHVPSVEVPNDVLRSRFAHLGDVVDELEAATGITRRFYAPDDWATSDLALPAARQALDRAGRRADEVDLLIVCTDTPDYLTPATSTVLQHKLGATRAGTFDIGCACASFPTGLATAAGWIQANPAVAAVLVVGAYLMQRLADPEDPTIFFYGDGSGAALLEAGDAPGFIVAAAQADGSYAERWGIFAGGTKEPASLEAVEAGRTRVRLVERYPPDVNHEGWPRLVRRLARDGGFEVADIDLVIFTQVRRPSVDHVMATLDLPAERTHTIMEKWGYTGSACLAMALDDALDHGKATAGDLVVFIGSGVGYNQTGAAFRL
ncbi:MAG: ketoacyl-ACP synthase III [Acidobacteriota bacterium]